MEFQFEPRNFIAGLLGGWATAFAVYQARHILGGIRRSFTERAESTRQYSLGSAEGRYVGELIKFCQSNHLAGGTIELSQIAVEPRFIPVQPLAAPPDEDVNRDPFRIMSFVHDHPYLYAPYHVVTASINDLNNGDRAVALLGLPGSGRTTTLQLIALWSLGEVDFKAPMDSVQMQLEAEEATLKAEERAARVKDRMTIEERAYERLAQEQGEDYEAGDGRKSGVPLLKRLLPLYVHLANFDLSEFGRRADPAEPLVRAIQSQVGSVTRKTVPRKLYDRLNKGTALVLLDGFDELPEEEQRRMIPWLRAFLREYRRNFIIIAGPATGFDDLTRLGFAPVYLRPWHDQQAHSAAEKWANHWSAITGVRRRENERPAERLVQTAKSGVRALSAFDLSLRLRGIYTGELQDTATQIELMQSYLRAVGMTDEVLGKAALAAALQLDEGFITQKRLEDIAVGRAAPVKVTLPPPRKADVDTMFQLDDVDDENEIDSLFSQDDVEAVEEPVATTPTVVETSPVDKKEQARIAKEQAQLLTSLERMGLIQRYKGGRYQFRYPLVTAYLASLTLTTAETLQDKAFQHEWEWALAYAAGHSTIDAAVQALLETPPDLLYANLLTVTRTLSYAPAKADWRVEVMKRLGNLFVHPAQFPLVRERVAAALVGSRDKNALVVFQKALKHSDPKIRILACLGIGAMGEADAVGVLKTMMRDTDADVQLAATLALGAIGTVEALEVMGTALVQGSEQLQRAAAEMFAAHPEEGYPVLYEAVGSQDIGLRRAAVFGLKRVPTPWALLAIYRVFLEDQQWYVRSAAQQVFIDMQDESGMFTRGYPNLETLPWLREWLEALGEEGSNAGPDGALLRMLQEGNPQMQAVSAEVMGQLGMADKLDELYATLLHDDEGVRVAAHRGLAAIQQRLGEELPAPV
jgi:hypothetical protein